jgi:hypothetical protein
MEKHRHATVSPDGLGKPIDRHGRINFQAKLGSSVELYVHVTISHQSTLFGASTDGLKFTLWTVKCSEYPIAPREILFGVLPVVFPWNPHWSTWAH